MTWNWQKPGWPNFTWGAARLRKAEEQFLLGTGMFAGAIRHLDKPDQEQLTSDAISTEALTTSEIEGEFLDRASVQSSVRRQFGFATDHRRVKPAEQGIAEMMVNLYRTFSDPLSDETLFAWHRMVTNGRRDLKNIGSFRTNAEPMQVVSGAIGSPTIHIEAPPASKVRKEMARFVNWFNRTAPSGSEPLPAVTRAGTAHLYFESIHPFEDGNGRIGRAISEKALAQSAGHPTLSALAATILIRRKSYYAALAAANKDNDLTRWLCWFAELAIEAQRRAAVQVEFLIDKTRLLDRLRGHVNNRQEKALVRMLREGAEGFKGGLSAGNYVTITGASPATATRDLADLVGKKALTRTGERRHARYDVAIALRPVQPIQIDKDGNLN